MSKAVIIGGGFGGLASALRLRKKGYEVLVLDRQNQLGGRGTVYKRSGFTYDAGPTVITAPFLFDELFSLFDKSLKEYLTFVPIAPWYLIRFEDGTTFRYGGNLEETIEEIRRIAPDDVSGYKIFLRKCRKIFDVGFVRLGDQPFSSLASMIAVAPEMIALKSYQTVYQLISEHVKNDKLRQVFSFHPLLVGGNPFNTTSIYSLIHHLEREYGVWYAMGGTGAIVSAFANLMEEVGIETRLGCRVDKILTENGAAVGVVTEDGIKIEADIVIANADPPFVYKNMLDATMKKKWSDERVEKLKYSMGLFVLYFGTSKQYPNLSHHTILLGKRYEELLRDIFEKKVLTEDLSLYLHAPSRTDSSMAPPGHECFYALAPVPNLQGSVKWSEQGEKFAAKILAYLEATILPDLKENLVDQFYVTPEHFRDNLLSHHGTGFSIQPTLLQSAYFRFHNESEDIRNLYFVGAGTHPGAGLPGVLTSAKVLDRIIPELPKGASEGSYNVDAAGDNGQSLLMNKRGKTFSWSALFLPRTIKRDLNQLYSFCRYVDDCADNFLDKEKASVMLDRISEDLIEGTSQVGVVETFIRLSEKRTIPMRFAHELINGVRADLEIVRFASENDLLRYAYKVAGTVGAMICHMLSLTDKNALSAGIDLAIGMQLTNIARDVQEDFYQGRIYLPACLIDPETVAAAVDKNETAQRQLMKAVNRLIELAETYYRSADNGICYLPASARLGILVSSRAYQKIGQLIISDPTRYFRSRVITTDLEKFSCFAHALLSLTKIKYNRTVAAPLHRAELHHAFKGLASFDAV